MTDNIFEAPAPGTRELDTTHFSKLLSVYTSSIIGDSFLRGFKEGTELFGLLMSHLKSVHIHGFSYSQPVLAFTAEDAPPGPPPAAYRDTADPSCSAKPFYRSRSAISAFEK